MKRILASALTLLLALGSILTPSVASATSRPEPENNETKVAENFDDFKFDNFLVKDDLKIEKPTISVRSNQTDGGGGGNLKPYWDNSKGAYIIPVYGQPRKGSELYKIGQGNFKRAALKRYGSINKKKTYSFNFINKVSQQHIMSMRGTIINVKCVNRK